MCEVLGSIPSKTLRIDFFCFSDPYTVPASREVMRGLSTVIVQIIWLMMYNLVTTDIPSSGLPAALLFTAVVVATVRGGICIIHEY